jgi:hypothetical protein
LFNYIFKSNVSKIEDLINNRIFNETELSVKELLIKDKNHENLVRVNSELNYYILKDKFKIELSGLNYIEKIQLIYKCFPEISEQKFRDSAYNIISKFCYEASVNYKNNYLYLSSFESLVPLIKFNYDEKIKVLINEVTRLMLTGTWRSLYKRSDTLVELEIKGVSQKSF